MLVVVCGSRSWTDGERIADRLMEFERGTRFISGGARGADRIAADIARGMGFEVEVMPAFWHDGESYNPTAGLERNIRMLDREPDLVLAFWDRRSTGTAHTISAAQLRDIPVEIVSPRPRGTDDRAGWGQPMLF
jgi:hypothetical protein